MNTYLLALQLMAVQGIMGAFDTLYHHELTEALPKHRTARKELSIHALRSMIYAVLFIGLSSWQWSGAWSLVLLGLFGVEIILTLWDFVIEDKTRLLPASERVTHTVLAINGGAFIALLVINTPDWFAVATALTWQPHGYLSMFLAACGIGVGLSGLRDALAAYKLGKVDEQDGFDMNINFGKEAKNFLVTGATGFIGQQLIAALLADGQHVTILTRNVKQAAWKFDGKVKCISNMQELALSHHIDVIINLAGARILGWRWSSKRKAVLRNSRVNTTEAIVSWIANAENKPDLLLSASAIGYYGIQEQGDDTELTEDSPSQSIFMSTLCQEWEASAQAAVEKGVDVACMRFGLVLGKEGALPMLMLPIKLGLGGSLGSGKQWLSWIHVDDLIRAMAHLINDKEKNENNTNQSAIYNFTAPEAVTQKRFSQIAAKIIHRPCFFPTPGWPMRLVLGEQSDLLLEGQRVAPTRLLKNGFGFSYPTLKQALESLY